MNRGELMYANLFDHKGPVVFLINYLGYFISGAFGIKILYLVCTLFFFAISFQISRLFTGNKQSIFVLLIIFLFMNIFLMVVGVWRIYSSSNYLFSLHFLKFFIIKDLKNYEIVLSGLFFFCCTIYKSEYDWHMVNFFSIYNYSLYFDEKIMVTYSV